MFTKKETIALTGSADGTGTFYSAPIQFGRVLSVTYIKDGTNPLTSGEADIVITAEATSAPILTITNAAATATYYPRAATCDVSGAASLYAAGGEPVEDHIPICADRIKVVLAQAGDATKVGTIVVVLG
jgi:hypothetical protein